jgi:protein AFG1
MLMDLFYNTLPPSITRKSRVHFHAFMLDVHKRIHAAKIAMGHRGGDPIPKVARDLAEEASVLCFDEFQVRITRSQRQKRMQSLSPGIYGI